MRSWLVPPAGPWRFAVSSFDRPDNESQSKHLNPRLISPEPHHAVQLLFIVCPALLLLNHGLSSHISFIILFSIEITQNEAYNSNSSDCHICDPSLCRSMGISRSRDRGLYRIQLRRSADKECVPNAVTQ